MRWQQIQTVAGALSEDAISRASNNRQWDAHIRSQNVTGREVVHGSFIAEDDQMTRDTSWTDSFPYGSPLFEHDFSACENGASSSATARVAGDGLEADALPANIVPSPVQRFVSGQSLPAWEVQSLPIMRPIPFLVDGIETPIERKVFYHYQHVVTDVLLLKTVRNPFVSTLIPRALSGREGYLVDAMIALSASRYQHFLIATGDCGDSAEGGSLEKLKWKRHGKAISQHIQMLDNLNGASSLGLSLSTPDARQLLILTMILYEFSICESNPGLRVARQMHLYAARELVRQIYEDDHYDCIEHDEFDHFLLELFHFHDVCSSFTGQGRMPCIDLHAQTIRGFTTVSSAVLLAEGVRDESLSARHICLLGLHDGLFKSLARVIDLRRRYPQTDTEVPSAELLFEGLEIEDELRSWHYEYGDRSKTLVAESYRLAVFIILWFAMYPGSSLGEEKIQSTVQEGLSLMSLIGANDNAQTCSLLPLFVFGVSATTVEHRELVGKKIRAYHEWARLANIEECLIFLQQYWNSEADMSASQRKWWDWESELQNSTADICLA
jgi:hypothetical protein